MTDLMRRRITDSVNQWINEPVNQRTSETMTCLASSSVPSATQFFESRSCYNVFSNLLLQSHLPGASQHHSRFAARSRDNAFCHSPANQECHTKHSRSADNRPPIRSVLLRFFCEIEVLLQFGAHFADLTSLRFFQPWIQAFPKPCSPLLLYSHDKTAPGHSSVSQKFSN